MNIEHRTKEKAMKRAMFKRVSIEGIKHSSTFLHLATGMFFVLVGGKTDIVYKKVFFQDYNGSLNAIRIGGDDVIGLYAIDDDVSISRVHLTSLEVEGREIA